jgi:hypothetical protein
MVRKSDACSFRYYLNPDSGFWILDSPTEALREGGILDTFPFRDRGRVIALSFKLFAFCFKLLKEETVLK